MKIISQGTLTTTRIELFTATLDELVIVQLENEKPAESTIECGTFLDKVALSDGGFPNQRELKIEVKIGDIIYGKSGINEVKYKIIA